MRLDRRWSRVWSHGTILSRMNGGVELVEPFRISKQDYSAGNKKKECRRYFDKGDLIGVGARLEPWNHLVDNERSVDLMEPFR